MYSLDEGHFNMRNNFLNDILTKDIFLEGIFSRDDDLHILACNHVS